MTNREDKHKPSKSALREWLRAFLIVILAIFLFRWIQMSGWIESFGVQNEKLTFGISFLVGVAASFSSCLAVVGGMVIAFSERYNSGGGSFWKRVFSPNIKFHVGRILTFFVLGGLLGLVGGSLNLSRSFVSAYTIIIALIMGWLGLSILGIVPPVSALGFRPPKFVLKLWGRLEDSEHRAAPYFLGGITFFLPCGFTQSMQILALASGSFWAGASMLSMFSLGTMPVLLMVGTAASWARFEKISFVSKAAGILVILFAVYTLNSGLAIRGLTNSERITTNGGTNNRIEKDNSTARTAAQKIEMRITSRGFEPSVLRVKNNILVRFLINGDGATGCTNKIIIPDFGIEKNIKKGENVIELTPKKIGPIAYSCWMGMVRGKIVVEP